MPSPSYRFFFSKPNLVIALGSLFLSFGAAHCAADLLSDASMSGPHPGTDGGPDAKDGGDAGTIGNQAIVHLVHASDDLFEFRVCFMAAGNSIEGNSNALPSDAPTIPQTNYAGVPFGGTAEIDGPIFPKAQAIDVHLFEVTAETAAAFSSECGELLRALNSPDSPRHVALTLPSGTFDDAKEYVLALTGCLNVNGGDAGEDAGAGSCGPLQATPIAVTSFDFFYDAEAGPLGEHARVLHLSQATGKGPVTITISGTKNSWLLSPMEMSPSVDVSFPKDLPTCESSTIAVTPNGADASISFTFSDIQKLTRPGISPATFFNREGTFVFVVAGDPSPSVPQWGRADAGVFDGRGLHVIAIPTH